MRGSTIVLDEKTERFFKTVKLEDFDLVIGHLREVSLPEREDLLRDLSRMFGIRLSDLVSRFTLLSK